MNKIALITGYGQDSKTLTHYLLSLNYKVIMTHRRNVSFDESRILSLFTDDLIKYPNSSVEIVFLDHSDNYSVTTGLNSILKKYEKIDEIYHLGADSNVGDSFKTPERQIQNNGTSAFYLLEWIRINSPSTKFYFAATSECFGGDPSRAPFNEESVLEPRSPYGISKVMGYNWTKFYRQTYGLYSCSGFLFNHSNYYRHPSFFIRRVTQSAAQIALGKINEITLGNLDFWRDETYADYMVVMMHKMLNNPHGAKDYVVGNGDCYHGEQFLDYAFGYFNLDWKKYVKQDKDRFRPNEVVKLSADSRLVQKDLGWIPNRVSFKTHIDKMCGYDYALEQGIINPKRPSVEWN